MVPAGRPRRERRQLPHERQRPEEELAGAEGDDEERDHHRHGALSSRAQRRRPDPAPEAVTPRSPAQVVELVEVSVLAEGRPDASGQDGHLGRVLGLRPGPLPRGDGVGRIEALVGEAADVAGEARAPPHLQPADLGVGEETVLRQLAPQHGELAQPAEVPAPGAGDRPNAVAVAGEHGHDDLAETQEHGLRQHPEEVDRGVALEHGPQLVPPLQRLHGDRRPTLGLAADRERLEPTGDGLAVAHPGVGRHHDPRARDLAPPRQVEVLAHGDDPAVEALQLGEEIRPHQDAAARSDEDVAHCVVLTVVDLAPRDAIHDRTRLVAAHPDVQDDAGIVPVHELRGHDAGVGAE